MIIAKVFGARLAAGTIPRPAGNFKSLTGGYSREESYRFILTYEEVPYWMGKFKDTLG